jgi:hypothetical protein
MSNPPRAKMVTPEPPVNAVKKAQMRPANARKKKR